jgi:hypothetical protein
MGSDSTGPEERDAGGKELEEQLKAFQLSQQAYLEENFHWLIEAVTGRFPEDQLAIRDLEMEVHFVHRVMESGRPLGALVYRFRKFTDKKEYFEEMGMDYQESLELPLVLFVDSETSRFAAPASVESEGNYLEVPPEQLAAKIAELREELKRRGRLQELRKGL